MDGSFNICSFAMWSPECCKVTSCRLCVHHWYSVPPLGIKFSSISQLVGLRGRSQGAKTLRCQPTLLFFFLGGWTSAYHHLFMFSAKFGDKNGTHTLAVWLRYWLYQAPKFPKMATKCNTTPLVQLACSVFLRCTSFRSHSNKWYWWKKSFISLRGGLSHDL